MFVDSSEETVHGVGSLHLVVFSLLDFISFNDSLSTFFEFSSNLGHSSLGCQRNGGPSIQVLTSFGGAPLVKTSAGLISDLKYLYACVSRVSWIPATVTETNCLNLFGGILIQANTVCESIQNTVLESVVSADSSASLQVLYNLGSVRHPIHSNRRMDFFFKGATNTFTMTQK